MTDFTARVNEHYGRGRVLAQILAGLEQAGKDVRRLSVDDLAPVDEFHTRGRDSTQELARMAHLKASDHVLDVGCGLGGTARHLAAQYECRVLGVDLTREFVEAGNRLTELVGLGGRVQLLQGSALELPFDDARFEVVWTEHAQMNIAEKQRLYAEAFRVLKPGGRFLFHDIFRGAGDPPVFPVPWAEEESLNHLAPEDDVRATLADLGFAVQSWRGKVEETLVFYQKLVDESAEEGLPPIGIHLLMGETAAVKLQNYLQNLREGRITVALGLARKG